MPSAKRLSQLHVLASGERNLLARDMPPGQFPIVMTQSASILELLI